MSKPILVEVWGDYACFTRPEFKVERVSYDVMTPSAARGILESLYWHPGMKWVVDRIYVLSPISFISIKRNEVSSVLSARNAAAVMAGKQAELAIYAGKDIQQRSSLILTNPHYVIEAHFVMTENAAEEDSPSKFRGIAEKRLLEGKCYSQPYFGCREFTAYFRKWDGKNIPAIPVTKDLGFMLYDMDYSDPQNIRAGFFRARMENGVVDVSGEVLF